MKKVIPEGGCREALSWAKHCERMAVRDNQMVSVNRWQLGRRWRNRFCIRHERSLDEKLEPIEKTEKDWGFKSHVPKTGCRISLSRAYERKGVIQWNQHWSRVNDRQFRRSGRNRFCLKWNRLSVGMAHDSVHWLKSWPQLWARRRTFRRKLQLKCKGNSTKALHVRPNDWPKNRHWVCLSWA